MAYIPNNLKVSKIELDNILVNLGENDATWETLVMVDYAYHCDDNDYDGGLSFLDRLAKKIGRFHPNWDIEMSKTIIRQANNPSDTYVAVVRQMLHDPSDVAYYGV